MSKILEKTKLRALNEVTRTDNTDVLVPPIGAKLSEERIAQIEDDLKLEIPADLVQIFTRIGNGGFGPGYGFMPLIDEGSGKTEETILSIYRSFSGEDAEDESWAWPEEQLPIIDWGCAIRSCVDCDTGEVLLFDPNIETEDMDDYFLQQAESLEELLIKWCNGINLWKEIYGE